MLVARKKFLTPANHLVAGGELLGVVPGVVGNGVSQVVAEVLKRALASDDGLHEESEHREHSQAAVLDLLDLELSEGIGIVSQTQGVEGATRVEAVKAFGKVEAGRGVTESLSLAHEDHQDSDGSDDRLGMDQVGVAKVVQAILREDSGLHLEPLSISAEVDGAGALQVFGDDAAESTKHSPAGVDELDFAVAGESLGVSGQTSGIPAVVTGVFACRKRRESSQEKWEEGGRTQDTPGRTLVRTTKPK